VDRAERRGGYRICQWDLHDEVHSYALQSVVEASHAGSAAVLLSIPLPRPRPFAAGGSRAVYLPLESRP
jgi:hypothetical protein